MGQSEPGLSAIRLWEKSWPFLLSFPGIHFGFLDFVFAQLGSSFIVHTSIQEVISREEPLLCFWSLDTKRSYSEIDSLLDISSKCHRCLNIKVLTTLETYLNQDSVLPMYFTLLRLENQTVGNLLFSCPWMPEASLIAVYFSDHRRLLQAQTSWSQ